jgi:hypothetical protein
MTRMAEGTGGFCAAPKLDLWNFLAFSKSSLHNPANLRLVVSRGDAGSESIV